MDSRAWDVFCRVIDNYGDAGVCWRLCQDLARRGHQVRLWIDDARPLQWMADPAGLEAVQLMAWDEAALHFEARPGGVVIEAFGCELPDAVKARMAAATPTPQWVNLEYLSAEDYVERSHGLRSPQWQGPAAGLEKFFFYPGFTTRTGGLLREPGLIEALDAADHQPWLARQGVSPKAGERLVSLFCYDNPALPRLMRGLADTPTLVLACPGPGSRMLQTLQAANALPEGLRVQHLPFMHQDDFDRLLSACDLNLVRGEDSFVRAQWAGRPFVWHIYPQDDGAHEAKLQAFMDRAFVGMTPAQRRAWQALWRAWNGLDAEAEASGALRPPALAPATEVFRSWRSELLTQIDLVTQLQDFLLR
ncbi:elongation factor P maturation arginine rhamnosyltransferase EarP [Mitsuaria sp. WAJ17]|uniref:elongation factor P maturation arginine rhamnosyltransferase EarP n=1 Tax=Mitsuaria sp. WAJ17 TaxID=2761452 RepID=UPI0016016AED|nr:elongation factor P maturation arginine rhamnosyltransferase EarP [Mitsuaria sp. WAJ17]MBB2485586.1 elongation factor P maturation arginine rhamnosyltransferase EarP [Mitsuaria sp. WAJ17]